MNGWVKSRPAPPSPLANDTCVKGDGGTVPCGLNGLIAQCLNTKNEVGEFAQGLPGTGCGLIRSTRP
jgi:hypothetical protein